MIQTSRVRRITNNTGHVETSKHRSVAQLSTDSTFYTGNNVSLILCRQTCVTIFFCNSSNVCNLLVGSKVQWFSRHETLLQKFITMHNLQLVTHCKPLQVIMLLNIQFLRLLFIVLMHNSTQRLWVCFVLLSMYTDCHACETS